jgi:hypothetical protein
VVAGTAAAAPVSTVAPAACPNSPADASNPALSSAVNPNLVLIDRSPLEP